MLQGNGVELSRNTNPTTQTTTPTTATPNNSSNPMHEKPGKLFRAGTILSRDGGRFPPPWTWTKTDNFEETFHKKYCQVFRKLCSSSFWEVWPRINLHQLKMSIRLVLKTLPLRAFGEGRQSPARVLFGEWAGMADIVRTSSATAGDNSEAFFNSL